MNKQNAILNDSNLNRTRFEFIDLGIIDYLSAWNVQKETLQSLLNGSGKQKVFLLEHPPVFTLGRSTGPNQVKSNLLDDVRPPENIPREPCFENSFFIKNIRSFWVNRGGGITYHGLGQLVVYPIIAIKGKERNLNRLLSFFEELTIQLCLQYDVKAFAVDGKRGVWTKSGKLASIGIGIKKWILFHGISININCDLSYFDMINPCGIAGCKMVNLSQLTRKDVNMPEIKNFFIDRMEEFWRVFWT